MSEQSSHHSDNFQGAIYMFASVLLFSIMDTMVKWLGNDYPVSEIMFFRCSVALVPVLIIIWQAGGVSVLKTAYPWLHLLRSTLGLSTMFCLFTAYTLMNLADAVAVVFSAPLFMTALSVPIFKDKVGMHRWGAILVGFIGVIIIINPGAGLISPGLFFALIASLFMALSMMVVRKLGQTDHPACITFYFTIAGTILGFVLVTIEGWVTPDLFDLSLFILLGVTGAFGQYTMTKGFTTAETSIVAPLKYLSIIWSSIFAFILWGEFPADRVWIGAAIVILSGLYMMRRETLKASPKYRTNDRY